MCESGAAYIRGLYKGRGVLKFGRPGGSTPSQQVDSTCQGYPPVPVLVAAVVPDRLQKASVRRVEKQTVKGLTSWTRTLPRFCFF